MQPVDNFADKSVYLFSIAELAFISGDYGTGEKYAQKAFELSNMVNQRLIQANSRSLSCLGQILRGDLETTEEDLKHVWDTYSETNVITILTLASALSSVLAALRGEDNASQDYGQQSLNTQMIDGVYTPLARWGLALSCCNQHAFPSAKQHLQEALSQAHQFGSVAIQTWLLPIVAVITAHEGQKEWALELLALAKSHPFSPTGWHHCWPLLAALPAELESEFGLSQYQIIWARGQQQDLDKVVVDWLESQGA